MSIAVDPLIFSPNIRVPTAGKLTTIVPETTSISMKKKQKQNSNYIYIYIIITFALLLMGLFFKFLYKKK
jgi:hypothetical protein